MPKKKNTNQEQHDLALGDEVRPPENQTQEQIGFNNNTSTSQNTLTQPVAPTEQQTALQMDVELAAGIIGSPVGGLANMESSLGQIKHAVSRAITERDLLYSFMTELKSIIIVVKIRVGLLLIYLQAHLPKGKYQVIADDIFPDFADRKGRDAKAEAIC